MRIGFRRRAPASKPKSRTTVTGWRLAGFSGLAYRLANLGLPRPLSVAGVFLLFYLT
jgi:hypothetical protein